MAQGDTPITVVGNIVADPELRYTPNGAAVVNFRVASTPRRWDSQTNQFVDGEALFLTCNAWRQSAENAANSLSKGDRVIVTGRLRQRSFEDKNGERRSVFEVEVDEVGPSLRFATVQINKNQRGGNSGQGGQGGYNSGGQGGYGNNAGGFGGAAAQGGFGNSGNGGQGGQGGQGGNGANGGQNNQGFSGHNAAMDDPWNSAPQQPGFGDGDDEPPF